MAPVKLPRYVMFKGDNGNNLCLHYTEGHPYLCFNSSNRDLWGAHEVIPVPDMENVVMVKSLHSQTFWRRSPNWIWADQSSTPSPDHYDCLFKVFQLAPNKLALQNLGNDAFVKRLTTEGKTSALNAAASHHSNDVTAQMEVSEALIMRRVFDVEYEMDQMETTDMQPLVLGSARAKNNTSSKSDLAVTLSYEVTEVSTWNDSTTFTTGLSVTVSAGVPTVADVEATVSTELSITTEMGKENGKTTTVSSTYTVKDVKPGDQVVVKVSGTRAKGKVPYKYKYQDTRVDGLVLPVDTGVDGVFTGVQVVNIVWEATDSSGTKKTIKA